VRRDAAHRRREAEPHERRGQDQQPQPAQRVLHIVKRHGGANDSAATVAALHRHVEQHGAHRRGVAGRHAGAARVGRLHLRAVAVVLDGRNRFEREVRVAEHAPVTVDDGDARANRLADAIRDRVCLGRRLRVVSIEHRSRGARVALELISDPHLEPSPFGAVQGNTARSDRYRQQAD
jgi:hypothetical protein